MCRIKNVYTAVVAFAARAADVADSAETVDTAVTTDSAFTTKNSYFKYNQPMAQYIDNLYLDTAIVYIQLILKTYLQI